MITPSGDIKDMTVPWLFQDLRINKETGTVVFKRNTENIEVFFNNGDILFASSNMKDYRLGEFLMRSGKISASQFEKSSEIVIKTGKKLGAVLFEMRVLTAHDLVAQVKLQVKEIILKLFTWRQGHYLFDEGPLPLSEIIPMQMSTGDLVLEGLSNLDWKDVRKALPSLKSVLRPSTDPSLLFQSVHLDQNQLTVFSLIDGCKNISELCGMSGIGDFNTLRAIYALLALRLAEEGKISTEECKLVHEAVHETESAEMSNAEGPAPFEPPATKEAVQRAFESLGQRNYYEALGLDKSATPLEMRKAYLRFAKQYHPDRHFDPEMNDMKEKLEALFTRIHEAYETLNSPAKRNQYDRSLAVKSEQRTSAEQASGNKPDNKSAAAAQYDEGMKRFNQGNFWGADESFDWAMRLAPGDAEYVFRRGLTLARMPRRGREAEELLMKAIEQAPSNSEYHMELGNFYARSGLKAKALAAYRNALQYDPNSDKIQEAIRKLSG